MFYYPGKERVCVTVFAGGDGIGGFATEMLNVKQNVLQRIYDGQQNKAE